MEHAKAHIRPFLELMCCIVKVHQNQTTSELVCRTSDHQRPNFNGVLALVMVNRLGHPLSRVYGVGYGLLQYL